MKTRPNKILNRLPSPGAWLALAALLAAPLLFSGCNAGTAVLTYLLQDDDEKEIGRAPGRERG